MGAMKTFHISFVIIYFRSVPIFNSTRIIPKCFFFVYFDWTIGKKNTGFNIMCTISKILNGIEMSRTSFQDYFSFDNIAFMRYAPIMLVDVERSFLSHKNLLADNRQ